MEPGFRGRRGSRGSIHPAGKNTRDAEAIDDGGLSAGQIRVICVIREIRVPLVLPLPLSLQSQSPLPSPVIAIRISQSAFWSPRATIRRSVGALYSHLLEELQVALV